MDEKSLSNCYHEIHGNICYIKIQVGLRVKNIRRCDVYVDEQNFLIWIDKELLKFQLLLRRFDIKDMKNIQMNFNTSTRRLLCELFCYPETAGYPEDNSIIKNAIHEKENQQEIFIDLRKINRITDCCSLYIDSELREFDSNFGYGFGSDYNGAFTHEMNSISSICRVTNPSELSPLKRSINREIDESKDFSPDQYKLNFIELQIPDGHENPMKHILSFHEATLTNEEELLLHNITRTASLLVTNDNQTEVDCGLVSILLAICYDLRSTLNDVNCESYWTRAILSPCLCYFECFHNIKSTVESFLRRALIYPLYRNYDLSRQCVKDAATALHKGPTWIIKQLLATHMLFSCSDYNLETLNKYYIEDYIRYLKSSQCNTDHLELLSHNLKNVLLGINKNHLRLDLIGIEAELLKELINDIHLVSSESDGSIDGTDLTNKSDDESTSSENNNVG